MRTGRTPVALRWRSTTFCDGGVATTRCVLCTSTRGDSAATVSISPRMVLTGNAISIRRARSSAVNDERADWNPESVAMTVTGPGRTSETANVPLPSVMTVLTPAIEATSIVTPGNTAPLSSTTRPVISLAGPSTLTVTTMRAWRGGSGAAGVPPATPPATPPGMP